jgi:hypothetical protein
MGKITNKEIDNLVVKIINEAPIDYEGPDRMDPSIEDKITSRQTPYSSHPAIPRMSRDFIELISSKRFKDTVTKLRSVLERSIGSTRDLTSSNPMKSLLLLAIRALGQSSLIEMRNKSELEELAVNLIIKEMSIPPGSLQFDAQLIHDGSRVESEDRLRRQAEEPSREEMMDAFKSAQQHENDIEAFLDAMETFDKERAKRRLINSLIGGAAKKGQYMYHLVSEKLNDIDPNLIELYTVTTAITDHLYWLYPEEILQSMSEQGGGEIGTVEISNQTDPPTVIARAVNFPSLVHELVKGVYEVFGTHGLPDDPRQVEMIMAAEDTVPAEAWDLRLGPVFWELLQKSYPIEILTNDDMKYIQHYLFTRLSAMRADDFFELFREVLEEKPIGREKIQRMVNEIVKELEEGDEDEDEDDDDILRQLGL